jgi:hypothetical protein
MAAVLDTAHHDGSPGVVLARLVLFVGAVVGLYTRSARGKGLNSSAPTRPTTSLSRPMDRCA